MTDNKRLTIAFSISFGYFFSSLFIEYYGPDWLRWIAYPASLFLGMASFLGPIGLVLLISMPVVLTAILYWLIGQIQLINNEYEAHPPF